MTDVSCGWASRCRIFCYVERQSYDANGKVHPEFFPTRNCLTFFRGEGHVPFENRSSANEVQAWFLASKNNQKKRDARLSEHECRARRKWGVSRSIQTSAGATQRTPPAASGGPANREAHATGLESFHSDGSGRTVETSGWEAPAEIRLSTLCTPGESGGQPSWWRRGRVSYKPSAQADGSRARS